MKKKVYGILLIHNPTPDTTGRRTVKLSEGLRLWLERFGLKSDFHSFRSNAHLVLYFGELSCVCMAGNAAGVGGWYWLWDVASD